MNEYLLSEPVKGLQEEWMCREERVDIVYKPLFLKGVFLEHPKLKYLHVGR